MTLLRQLILVVVTLFVLLFAGSFTISVRNTQEYLSEQLRTISQDTATSLGLTLSPHFVDKEMIVVESMISAVFDSGYYREVKIRSVDGKPIVERIAPVTLEGVPPWFVRLVPLETPSGEALIMAGWQQAGTVTVAASPGQAYRTMWNNTVDSFWWFLGSSVLTFLLGIVALRFVLRPLHAVEDQAKAICDRQYPVQKRLPWTLELRSVVEAMNRMTSKVKEMFEEQAEQMERIRAENYRDHVTGLANRKYFDMQLRHLIAHPDHFQSGALILIEVRNLKEMNDAAGYAKVDAFLEGVGRLLQQQLATVVAVDHFAAHLSGADFAVVLADVADSDVEEFVSQLMNALPQLHDNGLVETVDIAHAGVALYHGQNIGELLAEADTALRAAQGKGANGWHLTRSDNGSPTQVRSASQWSEVLNRVLREGRIVLHTQTVANAAAGGPAQHQEVLLRVLDDDNAVIPAGIFIPMAKRLGLIEEFDRLVVREVMNRLAAGKGPGMPVAINLFPSSIRAPTFVNWLVAELSANPLVARELIFEVAEYGAVENLETLKFWVDRLRATGARTSIDHFGKGFASFGYLCETRIDYLKIDGSFITDLGESKDHRFFVESVIKIAHGLDIIVIAESVESDGERDILTKLGIDGLQGYGVGKPLAWEKA